MGVKESLCSELFFTFLLDTLVVDVQVCSILCQIHLGKKDGTAGSYKKVEVLLAQRTSYVHVLSA